MANSKNSQTLILSIVVADAMATQSPISLPSYDASKVGGASATVAAQGPILGHTPGSFSVSPVGGSHYSIPLQVPAGRGGFQPAVSIEYRSGDGNGPMGVGFSVSAASAIGRCASTLAEDSQVRGVKPPYRKSVQLNEVDKYNNVTKSLATYGDSGTESTEVSTEPDIDTAHWLVQRPKLVKKLDRSHDGKLQLSGTRTTQYSYHTGSGQHHLVKQTKSYGAASGIDLLISDHEYYADGQSSRVTGADASTGRKREMAYAYDPFGYPHAIKNALGQTSYTGYDPLLGKLKVAVDINGLRTDHSYDTLGRPVQTKPPTGLVKSIAYKAEDRNLEKLPVVETNDPSGAKTELVLDSAGRPLFERFKGFDGLMRAKKAFYDVFGRLLASSNYKRQGSTEATDIVQRSYDNLGRVIKQKEPGNAERLWSYDRLTITEIDTRKNTKVVLADQRGRIVLATDAANAAAESVTREYGYAPFGKLSRTQVKGVAHSDSSFGYDDGVLTYSIDAERGYKQFHHNAFGELVRKHEGESLVRRTDIEYDAALGRMTTRTVSDGGVLRSLATNTYDESTGAGARKTAGALLRSQLTDYVAGGAVHVTDFWFNGLGQLWMSDHTMPSESAPGATETLRVARSYDWLGQGTTAPPFARFGVGA